MASLKDINDLQTWEKVCERLLTLTRAGKIRWADTSDLVHRDDLKSIPYSARYKEWQICIYRYAYQYFQDEDQFTWVDDVAMELIDNKGTALWRLPKVPSRHALMDQIEFLHADVESLVDQLLAEDAAAINA